MPIELKPQDIALNITNPPDAGTFGETPEKTWAIAGQEKAIKALEMGISVRGKGYNIFVAGESGIGKHTAVFDLLNRNRSKKTNLRDIVYVQNFEDTVRPKHLVLPEGRAREFKDAILRLIDTLKDRVNRDLDTEAYKARKVSLIQEVEKMENKVLAEFEAQISINGFTIIHTEDPQDEQIMDIAPLIDGVTVRFENLQDKVSAGLFPEESWTEIRERYFAFMNKMNRIHREFKVSRKTLDKKTRELRIETIRHGVEEECLIAANSWQDESIKTHFDALAEDVIENTPWMEEDEGFDLGTHYGVNILLDRYGIESLPVVYETHPSRINLFGSIEARYDVSGELKTNMMMIKAGSLLKADGGFLILQAEDVFANEGLWPEFKRVLQTGHVAPEIQSTPLGPLPILMKPEPVAADATIILVGSETTYDSVCENDADFSKLFKITAEFSSVMVRNERTELEYAAFAQGFSSMERLKPMNSDGIKEIIAYGIQLAERRDRLSTHFGRLGDLIRESNYIAGKENKEVMDGKVVRAAIAYREQFSNLSEVELFEQIKRGSITIDVDGTRIGTVNGMAILEQGVYDFGAPLRISATVSPGKEGLINIERESGLSGEIHDKGVFLIEGYLRHRYARRQMLSLTADIAVEQSYHEIDGDSASAAELAALLSAIAEIPLRQDIAITGAVNQRGDVHPVGGIQKKIQGFFRACEDRGLTGFQGIVIPFNNRSSVILSSHVSKAMNSGQFHIWPVHNIDEVITLLSGMNAGRERRDGRFEMNSFNRKIARRLQEFAALS